MFFSCTLQRDAGLNFRYAHFERKYERKSPLAAPVTIDDDHVTSFASPRPLPDAEERLLCVLKDIRNSW